MSTFIFMLLLPRVVPGSLIGELIAFRHQGNQISASIKPEKTKDSSNQRRLFSWLDNLVRKRESSKGLNELAKYYKPEELPVMITEIDDSQEDLGSLCGRILCLDLDQEGTKVNAKSLTIAALATKLVDLQKTINSKGANLYYGALSQQLCKIMNQEEFAAEFLVALKAIAKNEKLEPSKRKAAQDLYNSNFKVPKLDLKFEELEISEVAALETGRGKTDLTNEKNQELEQLDRRRFLGRACRDSAIATSPFWLGIYQAFRREHRLEKTALGHKGMVDTLLKSSKTEKKAVKYIKFQDPQGKSFMLETSPLLFDGITDKGEYTCRVSHIFRFLLAAKTLALLSRSTISAQLDNGIEERKAILQNLKTTLEGDSRVEQKFKSPSEALAHLGNNPNLLSNSTVSELYDKLIKESLKFVEIMGSSPFLEVARRFLHDKADLLCVTSFFFMQMLADLIIEAPNSEMLRLEKLFEEANSQIKNSNKVEESKDGGLLVAVKDLSKLSRLKESTNLVLERLNKVAWYIPTNIILAFVDTLATNGNLKVFADRSNISFGRPKIKT